MRSKASVVCGILERRCLAPSPAAAAAVPAAAVPAAAAADAVPEAAARCVPARGDFSPPRRAFDDCGRGADGEAGISSTVSIRPRRLPLRMGGVSERVVSVGITVGNN